MTAVICTPPTTDEQVVAAVHSTQGVPLVVDHFQEPGVHLVSLQCEMPKGQDLVDLTTHAALELALQLISNALGDAGVSEWEGAQDCRILSLEGEDPATSLDVVHQPLIGNTISVLSDLHQGPAQELEGLSTVQARTLAMMLLEASLSS